MTSPGEYLLGAGSVGRYIARSAAAIAGSPVGAVDLPETNIIRAIGVVELSVRVSTALVVGDALAAGLVPARIGRALCSYVNDGSGFSAVAGVASA